MASIGSDVYVQCTQMQKQLSEQFMVIVKVSR